MNASQTEARWWMCCWGHIFEHDPVQDGEELSCPDSDGDVPCDTTLIYAPFRSHAEAEDAMIFGKPDWAPWVR